jgi:arsenical pump membrane protein
VPIILLVVVLVFSVIRPKKLPEAIVAVPAALALLVFGYVSSHDALAQTHRLSQVVLFLGAILVVADICARDGVFEAMGHLLARKASNPRRLLQLAFLACIATTSVLSLDATVVLLTPALIRAGRRTAVDVRPAAYAAGHLSNSASLLLPVSNLTNLLAYSATGLSFIGFAFHMALPTLFVIAVEYLCIRLWFRKALSGNQIIATNETVNWPKFTCWVTTLMLIGFVVTSPFHIDPAWPAAIGALTLVARHLKQQTMSINDAVRAANLPFCAFVIALAIVVLPVANNGIGHTIQDLLPSSDSLPSLLTVAFIAAITANLFNNLPTTLLLLSVMSDASTPQLLAMLIGVNVGPNLTYAGSLATLLWRSVLHRESVKVRLVEFSALGTMTVVIGLIAATFGLWLTF